MLYFLHDEQALISQPLFAGPALQALSILMVFCWTHLSSLTSGHVTVDTVWVTENNHFSQPSGYCPIDTIQSAPILHCFVMIKDEGVVHSWFLIPFCLVCWPCQHRCQVTSNIWMSKSEDFLPNFTDYIHLIWMEDQLSCQHGCFFTSCTIT